MTAECVTVQLVSVLWLGSKGEAEGGECRGGQKYKQEGNIRKSAYTCNDMLSAVD